MIAASAPPPAPSTAVDANWAEPAKRSTDITIGATFPMIGAASTPKEIESTSAATA